MSAPAPRAAAPVSAPAAATAATARIVLLGASNLTLSFPWLRTAALATAGHGHAEVLVAGGLGRAYSVPSRFLLQARPAIVECALWDHLADAHRRRPLPLYALLTDLGNDLAYGATAADLAAAIGACLARLRPLAARCVITGLPLGSIENLSPLRFMLLRSVLFPGRAISRAELLVQGRFFDRGLRELCVETGCTLAEIGPERFGLDHIHLTWRWRRRLWPELLAGWRDPASAGSAERAGELSGETSTRWF